MPFCCSAQATPPVSAALTPSCSRPQALAAPSLCDFRRPARPRGTGRASQSGASWGALTGPSRGPGGLVGPRPRPAPGPRQAREVLRASRGLAGLPGCASTSPSDIASSSGIGRRALAIEDVCRRGFATSEEARAKCQGRSLRVRPARARGSAQEWTDEAAAEAARGYAPGTWLVFPREGAIDASEVDWSGVTQLARPLPPVFLVACVCPATPPCVQPPSFDTP